MMDIPKEMDIQQHIEFKVDRTHRMFLGSIKEKNHVSQCCHAEIMKIQGKWTCNKCNKYCKIIHKDNLDKEK